jgi:hypothetical protein
LQQSVESLPEMLAYLTEAGESGGPGWGSVYSFPRGHSQDGNIPRIDTVFIDMDIPSSEGDYDPKEGGTEEEWRRDVSKLLVRARMVARTLLDDGLAKHFRVAYSGHKGIHLYIDMDPISPDLGPLSQYKNGIQAYADGMIDHLEQAAGVRLHEWVDVTSHDLGRVARVPNTPHHGSKHVDWTTYCVPGSIEELAGLDTDGYLEATRQPRKPLNDGRQPSERATEVMTEHIKEASDSSTRSTPGTSSRLDKGTLKEYKKQSNDAIDVETVREILIAGKPCIEEFVERDDAYDFGAASRTMEISVIKELSSHGVPIDVMVEFFSDIPRFDEGYTRDLIEDIIARYHPTAFVCRNVVKNAPEFCLGESCAIYQNSDDLEE